MSEDLPSAAAVAAAYEDMRAQKEAGEWDEARWGDVPARLGPLPVPEGWRTLSEVADAIAGHHAFGHPHTLPQLLHELQAGRIEAHALDANGRVVRIPSTLWLHLADGPGGQHNIALTVAWDCLTGSAFEPDYVGLTPVVSQHQHRHVVEVYSSTPPWSSFPSVHAWLKSPDAESYAAGILRLTGAIVSERAIRDCLFVRLDRAGFVKPNGEPRWSRASIAAIRRASKT